MNNRRNVIKEIEHNLFLQIIWKTYFENQDIGKFFGGWNVVCKREENMARWCKDKIV